MIFEKSDEKKKKFELMIGKYYTFNHLFIYFFN